MLGTPIVAHVFAGYKCLERKVQQVFPDLNKVVVEGLNIATKHLKGRGDHKVQQVFQHVELCEECQQEI